MKGFMADTYHWVTKDLAHTLDNQSKVWINLGMVSYISFIGKLDIIQNKKLITYNALFIKFNDSDLCVVVTDAVCEKLKESL